MGESPLQGVLRETKEESNISCNSVKFYDYTMHMAENGKNWTSFMFICDDFDDSNIVNQKSEVEPWGWYSVEEALAMDLFPPTRKSLERAIVADLVHIKHEPANYINNYINFVNCPTSASSVSACHDSCVCAYSFSEPEQIFTTHQAFPWD